MERIAYIGIDVHKDTMCFVNKNSSKWGFSGYNKQSATTISKQEKPEGFEENKKVAVRGGKAANSARDRLQDYTLVLFV